jgi:DNA repair exonuclease SbcCD ATPase subunit
MSTNDGIPKSLRNEIANRRQNLERTAKRRDALAAEIETLRQAQKAENLPGSTDCAPASAAPQNREDQKRRIEQRRATIKARLETLRNLKSEIETLKKALKQLMQECHRYEPDILFRSNVAGDPMHLRMPASRSGCWTHAVRLPKRDDS